MNIVQITPGAGGMYCGNCFRDNALVRQLRQMGHTALMAPLYLPLKLDEADTSQGTPIFFSGVNVYLEQKAPFFRHAPQWLHQWLASPALLGWAARFAAKTRPEDVGDLTLSMLRGEHGNQAREVDELVKWLQTQHEPDVICLSNCLLAGLIRRLKAELPCPVVCMLQGEDSFLDALPSNHRTAVWATLAERLQEADLFVAPSRYFAERMRGRLGLSGEKMRVVFNGISLEGYETALETPATPQPPVIGYFARMCPEKGLDTLIDAFMLLKERGTLPGLRLRVGGGCGPGDEAFVQRLRSRLSSRGYLGEVEFHPNLNRSAKLAFLKSLTVLSVPALYGEAFGLYLIEALAAGVPVVQPRHAAFPELIEATGGGVLFEPGSPVALADALEAVLRDRPNLQQMGQAGRDVVRDQFSVERMATNMLDAFRSARPSASVPAMNLQSR